MITPRKSRKGLDSGIGGFTHTISPFWRPDPRTWAEAFIKRHEARMEAKDKAARLRELRDELHSELLTSVLCVTCGSRIERGTETPAQWRVIRRCEECKAKNIRAGEVKFCRCCGKRTTRSEYMQMEEVRESKWAGRGWGSYATCGACKDDWRVAQSLIEEFLKERG